MLPAGCEEIATRILPFASHVYTSRASIPFVGIIGCTGTAAKSGVFPRCGSNGNRICSQCVISHSWPLSSSASTPDNGNVQCYAPADKCARCAALLFALAGTPSMASSLSSASAPRLECSSNCVRNAAIISAITCSNRTDSPPICTSVFGPAVRSRRLGERKTVQPSRSCTGMACHP